MFKKKAISAKDDAFETALIAALEELPTLTVDSDEYTAAMKNIHLLNESLTSHQKPKMKISGDTLLSVGGSLAGIVLILGYERAHVVASKALGFVLKTKV